MVNKTQNTKTQKKKKTRHDYLTSRTTKLKTNNNTSKYSYLIKTDYYDMEMIANLFRIRGNWEPYNPQTHAIPDFFYIDGLHIADKSLYNIKSKLKSLVGDGKKQVVVKNNLYENLLKKCPESRTFLPWTLELDIKGRMPGYLLGFKKYFRVGKPLICKIANQGEGQNIITTDRFDIWQKFMTNKITMIQKRPLLVMNKWVLQEYIANPQLKNGRKFHLRLMLLYQPHPKKSYYIPVARAALAEAPYQHGDWTNKDIHDTHFHRKEGLLFPSDFQELSPGQLTGIYKQIDTIAQCVIRVITPSCYPDSLNCYELFGLDLLITQDYQVKLIEVNDRIGMSGTPAYKKMTFAGIMKLVVDDYFPPVNPQPPIYHEQFRPVTPRY